MYLFFFLLLFFLLCSNEKVLGYLMLQIMIVIFQIHHDPISNKFCEVVIDWDHLLSVFPIQLCFIAIVSLSSNILSMIKCNEGFQLLFPLFIGFSCGIYFTVSPAVTLQLLQSLWTDTYTKYFIQHPYNDKTFSSRNKVFVL